MKKVALGLVAIVFLLSVFAGCDNDNKEDTTAPVITAVTSLDITTSEATITWTTDEEATSQVEYGITESYGSTTTLDANLVISHSVNLTGLTPGTTYHFQAKSEDEAGNEVSSEDNTLTTTVLPTATLSGQPAGVVNNNTADITVAGANVVAYKYKLDAGSLSVETPVTTHITLSGLADGLHTVSVIGKDAAGNWQTEASATAASWTVTTIIVTATLSGQPSNVVGYGTADITVTGVDVVAYKYRLDGAAWSAETAVSTHIILTGLADGPHTVSVVGKNAAGNWQADASATTASWTVTSGQGLFPDANLEAAIREAIGMPTGEIDQSDLVGLTGLVAPGRGIANLTGLELCTNLTDINLSDNQISDISVLSSLTKLTRIGLWWNQIDDLSPLASLTGLTYLTFGGNQISDLSPLASLTGLTYLGFDSNQISNISVLSSLTSLNHLNLYDNQISDISALASLTGLTYLYLGSNQISDISALASLTSLAYLNLNNNQISNISALSSLTSLTSLGLWLNQISDISVLSSLTSLTSLYLGMNQISDIQPLVNNAGLGMGDSVNLMNNTLNATSVDTYIPQLVARGVTVTYTP